MKFLIILGFLLGFGAVLSAAGLAPIAIHERIASRATVANNGGRVETFVIRLPADRIAATGNLPAGAAAIDPVTKIDPPDALANAEFVVEQFKIRNIDGDVIGTAMRHWTRADGRSASTWSVSIPSRGTLLWNAEGDAFATLSAAMDAAGARSGAVWEGRLAVAIATDQNAGQVILGTEEFLGSAGTVEETWELSGVGGNGELRGTISLTTRVSQPS
jgi:hypothetical protein